MNNSFALEVLLIVVFWRVDFLLMYHSGGHVTDALILELHTSMTVHLQT